ncbi:MAG: hypothetical protein J5748_02795 [Bacteroidales bacterium]|nr:hypothetical protein [Bacteroidales bacterium]
MKKTILIALLCCLASGPIFAEKDVDTVLGEKSYILIGGGLPFSPDFYTMGGEAQLEYGCWFMPQMGFAVSLRGYAMRGSLDSRSDAFFKTSPYYAGLRFTGLMDWTNLAVGGEVGARAPFHIGSYLGGELIYNMNTTPITSIRDWRNYIRPVITAGMDFSFQVDRRLRLYLRAGVNTYHLSYHNLHPEANLGMRIAIGKGRVYAKDPSQSYKNDIAELEKELAKEKGNVKVKYRTDTLVVKETQEVEKIVRDTVILKVNQVDTLTIYDVVEVGSGAAKADTVFIKADTVYIKSLPEILVKTVYADSVSSTATDAVFPEPVVQVDTVYVLSEPEVQVKVQTDTVFVHSEPEVMVRTVYVNKEPIVLRDTVFVATDPEVQIQTVYRDKEPIVLVDTVFVQSEPEIEVRTVYRDREVVKVQKDTVFLELEPEVQVKVVKDTVFLQSEPEVQIQVQKDTVFLQSEPEIMVRTVYVNKEPVIVKDTVFVASDPEVQIQTVYRDKEPVIVKDTVFVQSEPEIEIRYRDREVVKEVVRVQTDTVVVEKDPIIQVDTVVIEKDPVVQIDTVVIEKDPVVQVDTVVIEKDPIVQVDTVVVEKDPVVQTDTVVVKVPVEPESTLIYVVFPENAAWVNYGARKQLDKISKEIKAYDGSAKYLLIAPVSPDSEDTVKAYNLGVRRVSQVRLHLIRENGVDSRKLRETVLISPAGIAKEDGNGFVIVAREDDPRIGEILEQ